MLNTSVWLLDTRGQFKVNFMKLYFFKPLTYRICNTYSNTLYFMFFSRTRTYLHRYAHTRVHTHLQICLSCTENV